MFSALAANQITLLWRLNMMAGNTSEEERGVAKGRVHSAPIDAAPFAIRRRLRFPTGTHEVSAAFGQIEITIVGCA